MRFGFNYGVGAGSSRYRNSYLISYLMDTIYTDGAMDRFLDNVGSNGSNNDAVAFASNHIFLNAQSVPYPTLHTLGSEIQLRVDDILATGDEIISYTKTSDTSFDLAVTTVGTNTERPFMNNPNNGNVPADGNVCVLSFDAVVNSGTPVITIAYINGDNTVNYEVVNGYNELVLDVGSSTSGTWIYWNGTNLFDISVTNWTVKEITLPIASYLTYFDSATNTLIELSSTGDVGENLVINDDFSEAGTEGWTEYVSGATLTNTNNEMNVDIAVGGTNGAKYEITTLKQSGRMFVGCDIEHVSGVDFDTRITDTWGGTNVVIGASGVYGSLSGILDLDGDATNKIAIFTYDTDTNQRVYNMDNVVMRYALDISTTYSVTDSHQFVFNHTSPLSAADKAAIEADPNLAFRMFLDGEVLPSGFSNTDVGWFSGGNEGLASGAFIQDLSVNLGTEVLESPNFEVTTDWASTGSWVVSVGSASCTASTSEWLYQNDVSEILLGRSYLINVEISEYTAGSIYVTLGDGASNATIAFSGVGLHTYIISIDDTAASNRPAILTQSSATLTVSSFSVKEVSAVEIEAYDTATRTILANQSNGASNLKLIRDSSGRTTGTALANTTQWKADGRTVVTNWTITAPYTITEIIGVDTYTFTSDLNRYKNSIADGTFIAPTGIWTLDEFGFDGVTSVTARGKTSLVDAVVIP